MLFVKTIFVLLHILMAASWFGLGLRLATQARTALSLALPAGQALADDASRTVRFMGIFIVLALVFALVAFFIGGGFAVYGPAYHTSMLLILLIIVVQYALLRPAWEGLREALASTPPEGERFRKRIAMSMGIGQLLWVVVLVLMYWETLSTGF